MTSTPETILQFGTGRFLRSFVDLFVEELRQADAAVGQVAVVQSTASDRVNQLRKQQGRYHVAVRGLRQGKRIDRAVEVRSIGRAFSATDDWPDVLELARSDSLRTIVSNTTEAGYALSDNDVEIGSPPRSFPAKLLAVLQERFHATGAPLTILPCELLDGNADRLRSLVLEQAGRWRLGGPLIDWMLEKCSWHNTLVDRIVAAPKADDPMSTDSLAAEDPLLSVAEPFALWLIEGEPPECEFLQHAAVRPVEKLAPYALRKVRVLNGAHTALVAKALPMGMTTVREAVADPQIAAWLRALLFEEIVPTIAERTEDAEQFAADVLERFANPFLDHRLADIALHQEVKIKTRLAPTHAEYCSQFGRPPKLLDEILER